VPAEKVKEYLGLSGPGHGSLEALELPAVLLFADFFQGRLSFSVGDHQRVLRRIEH